MQLIDATDWFEPLRKNLGKKNCRFAKTDMRRVVESFLAFAESEQSKIFPNKAFGYSKITVERPLRLTIDLADVARARFRKACATAGEEPLADLIDALAATLGAGPHRDYNRFLVALEQQRQDTKLTAKRLKFIQSALATRDETAEPVISKVYRGSKAVADPLHGHFAVTLEGKPAVVEYEPDSELRDTEQVPLLEQSGIAAFIKREVLPYVPDAWVDQDATKVGYEISFTRYFYKPQPLRTLEAIRAEIEALERETEGLLSEIIGKDRR